MDTNAPIEPRSEGRFSTAFGRLRNRLILLVLMTVLPALILAILNGVEERRAGVARAKMDAVRIAKLAAAQQQGLVENTRHLLGALGDLSAIHLNNAQFWNVNFGNLLHLQPIYLNFGLVDTNGSLFASALTLKGKTNFSQDTFFKKAARTGRFSVGEFDLGSFTNKPALNFGYPIHDTNQQHLSRVLFASLDLSFINQVAAQADLPKDSVLLILDSQSQILYRSLTAARWIGTSIADTPLGKAIRASIEGTAETTGEDGVERLYGFVPIRNFGEPSMTVVVGIPREMAYVTANRTLLRNLGSLFLIAIAALAGARLYAQRQILNPVQTIITASKKLAAGDLSARTHLKPGTSELHHLAESFD